jgi:hypothetical protein
VKTGLNLCNMGTLNLAPTDKRGACHCHPVCSSALAACGGEAEKEREESWLAYKSCSPRRQAAWGLYHRLKSRKFISNHALSGRATHGPMHSFAGDTSPDKRGACQCHAAQQLHNLFT